MSDDDRCPECKVHRDANPPDNPGIPHSPTCSRNPHIETDPVELVVDMIKRNMADGLRDALETAILGRPLTDAERAASTHRIADQHAAMEARRKAAFDADQVGAPEGMVAVRLVPVEVFGVDDDDGYGLMDVTGAQSDCNRARGHIFRVDDIVDRDPEGGNVLIYVKAADLPFLEKRWEG